MKMKNIPVDIKSKSLNEAKSEISSILGKLESEGVDLESSTKEYQRLLYLSRHVESIFKERINKIRSKRKKNENE